nr:MAG TPA: Terminase [Caudoviricetes sp.]
MSNAQKRRERSKEEELAYIKGNFVVFLFVLWRALNLPKPTKCQIDMSKALSGNPKKRFILQAFRGIGKSFITCAYVVWKLWNNPDLKFLIVSASKERADANSIFIKRIIDLLPFLHHLKPQAKQRDSTLSFDVGPAKPDHSPSVKSAGITGQITGSRADILIADDVEVPGNSGTQASREHLATLVTEFDAILKPGPDSMIIYLGTPQCENTLYRSLESKGYSTTIWPARYPADQKALEAYGDRLAPMLRNDLMNDNGTFWEPTDPVRFSNEDLMERELSYGKAGFAMQFMLNPNLSDAERYPLRLRDLIVGSFSADMAPTSFQWMPNPQNLVTGLPVTGLNGDAYHRYHSAGNQSAEYTAKILVVDPSGRGKDETGWAVLYMLNGYIFLMDAGGYRGGYDKETLQKLANKAKQWKVNEVLVEGNFGDGMYLQLLTPILTATWRCALIETKSKGQKELRICDVLEPVMGSHRLVVNEKVIEDEYRLAHDNYKDDGGIETGSSYSLFYQMTHITRDRGAIKHDDRLDAVAIGVQYFTESMAKDSKVGESELMEEFLEHHMSDDRMGFDSMREMTMGDCLIQYEDDRMGSNYMGW